MDKSPPPVSLAAALALPLPKGRRSSEVFVDADLEISTRPKGTARSLLTTATRSTSSRRGEGSCGSETQRGFEDMNRALRATVENAHA